jgi:hypothetical protein
MSERERRTLIPWRASARTQPAAAATGDTARRWQAAATRRGATAGRARLARCGAAGKAAIGRAARRVVAEEWRADGEHKGTLAQWGRAGGRAVEAWTTGRVLLTERKGNGWGAEKGGEALGFSRVDTVALRSTSSCIEKSLARPRFSRCCMLKLARSLCLDLATVFGKNTNATFFLTRNVVRPNWSSPKGKDHQ